MRGKDSIENIRKSGLSSRALGDLRRAESPDQRDSLSVHAGFLTPGVIRKYISEKFPSVPRNMYPGFISTTMSSKDHDILSNYARLADVLMLLGMCTLPEEEDKVVSYAPGEFFNNLGINNMDKVFVDDSYYFPASLRLVRGKPFKLGPVRDWRGIMNGHFRTLGRDIPDYSISEDHGLFTVWCVTFDKRKFSSSPYDARYKAYADVCAQIYYAYYMKYPSLMYASSLADFPLYQPKVDFITCLKEFADRVYAGPVSYVSVGARIQVSVGEYKHDFDRNGTLHQAKNFASWNVLREFRLNAMSLVNKVVNPVVFDNGIDYCRMLGALCVINNVAKPMYSIRMVRDHGVIIYYGEMFACGVKVLSELEFDKYDDMANHLAYEFFSGQPHALRSLEVYFRCERLNTFREKLDKENKLTIWLSIVRILPLVDLLKVCQVSKFHNLLVHSSQTWYEINLGKVKLWAERYCHGSICYGSIVSSFDVQIAPARKQFVLAQVRRLLDSQRDYWLIRQARVDLINTYNECDKYEARWGWYHQYYRCVITYNDKNGECYGADKRSSRTYALADENWAKAEDSLYRCDKLREYSVCDNLIPYDEVNIYNCLRSGSCDFAEELRNWMHLYFRGGIGAVELNYPVDPYGKQFDVYFVFVDWSTREMLEFGMFFGPDYDWSKVIVPTCMPVEAPSPQKVQLLQATRWVDVKYEGAELCAFEVVDWDVYQWPKPFMVCVS